MSGIFPIIGRAFIGTIDPGCMLCNQLPLLIVAGVVLDGNMLADGL